MENSENRIAVTLGELLNSLPRFQKLLQLPKPPALAWRLTQAQTKEIQPALENFNKLNGELFERYGVKLPNGDISLADASEENKRRFTIEQAELLNQKIALDLEPVDGAKLVAYLDARGAAVGDELTIDWLIF